MGNPVIPFKLPDDFLMGTATASAQIEGGDKNNNWYRWAEQGRIKDGSHCIVAADHWNRVDEDIKLMKSLNCKLYRLSLEWSRIEPQRGQFDLAAIAHYRSELEKLQEAGIKPLVTLHHFSNPLWLEDEGAWLNSEVIDLFERYTAFAVAHLGDLVSDWVTINEPNVYLLYGYIFGEWPPGKKSMGDYFKGAGNMIRAHIMAYRKIHELRKTKGYEDTLVGVANHLRLYDSKNDSSLEKLVCRLYDRLTQEIFISGMTEGKLIPPLGAGYPLGKGRYFDFFGINYYTRDMIGFTFDPAMMFGRREVKEGAETNDLGWELYAEGLYRLCKKYYRRFGVPVFVTENGTCDNQDCFRTKYIYDHLYELKRLNEEGIQVPRYYHWTLMDNFEWIEGLSARFGLVEVDFETQERRIRRSGEFFAEVSSNNGVTEEMIQKYLLQN